MEVWKNALPSGEYEITATCPRHFSSVESLGTFRRGADAGRDGLEQAPGVAGTEAGTTLKLAASEAAAWTTTLPACIAGKVVLAAASAAPSPAVAGGVAGSRY